MKTKKVMTMRESVFGTNDVSALKPSHTPTPCRNPIHATPCDMFCEGCLVDCWEENKPYIVKCVNAHEELVRLVRKADNYIHNQERAIPEDHGNDCQYCRALAQAEGK